MQHFCQDITRIKNAAHCKFQESQISVLSSNILRAPSVRLTRLSAKVLNIMLHYVTYIMHLAAWAEHPKGEKVACAQSTLGSSGVACTNFNSLVTSNWVFSCVIVIVIVLVSQCVVCVFDFVFVGQVFYWTQVYLGSNLWVWMSLTTWCDSDWWRDELHTN